MGWEPAYQALRKTPPGRAAQAQTVRRAPALRTAQAQARLPASPGGGGGGGGDRGAGAWSGGGGGGRLGSSHEGRAQSPTVSDGGRAGIGGCRDEGWLGPAAGCCDSGGEFSPAESRGVGEGQGGGSCCKNRRPEDWEPGGEKGVRSAECTARGHCKGQCSPCSPFAHQSLPLRPESFPLLATNGPGLGGPKGAPLELEQGCLPPSRGRAAFPGLMDGPG